MDSTSTVTWIFELGVSSRGWLLKPVLFAHLNACHFSREMAQAVKGQRPRESCYG
jgi:hypothetical protein